MIITRQLGIQPYELIWQQMRDFTLQRTPETPDEIWLLEHLPVFTQGQAGKAEHIHDPANIPIVQSDRGGQVTYHGPGQLIVYVLLNLKKYQLGVRKLVNLLEQSVIDMLQSCYHIESYKECARPGVYVNQAKICSLGLRIRQHYCYHGLALNVSMDLSPFARINPCGYENMAVTQLSALAPSCDKAIVATQLLTHIQQKLEYTSLPYCNDLETMK